MNARDDVAVKEHEIDGLKSEITKLKDEVGKAAEGGKKTDAVQQELEKAREEGETLKQEIEQLRKDNEKLKDDATAKIRNRAIGEKSAEVTATNGRVYRQVMIKKIDDEGVSISHDAGSATLRVDTAPPAWVERFRLAEKEVAPPPPPPAEVAPVAEAVVPAKKGKKDDNSVVQSKLGGVFIVEGETNSGTAFIAMQDGAMYLYTAAHVLSSGKKLVIRNSAGAVLSNLGACQVATDCDLARIEVDVKPELAATVVKPGTVAVGLEITAVGNSAGSGVLPLLNGKVMALGPNELEVSAAVIKGNSGGPVFSTGTGEVIGVVTRAEAGQNDIWAKGSDFSKIRRFASRLDRPIPWRTTALERLQTENSRIATFDSRTRLVYAMAALEPGQNGLRLDMQLGGGSGPTILSIFMQHKNIAPVQRLIQMNSQLEDRQLRSSERDLKKRFSGFYRDLLTLFANDTSEFTPENFSFPNRKSAGRSLEWRKEATKSLQTAAAALGR